MVWTYTVTVAASNFAPGGPLNGLANTADPDNVLDNTSNVTLTPSVNVNLDQDFGYRATTGAGSIGNLVWSDANKDGVKDGGEIGIAGVTLDLYADLNGNKAVDPGEPKLASTVTDGSGAYGFSGLSTVDNGFGDNGADYVVVVTDVDSKLTGYMHTLGAQDPYTNLGNDPVDSSKAEPFGVSIGNVNPSDNLNVDFGYFLMPPLDTTVAVTLSYAFAERVEDGTVYFLWETATETQNAGFKLYMELGDSSELLVTSEMVPSSVIDSVEPQRYTYQANVPGDRYFIEMISLDGSSERYGAYDLGVEYGEPSAVNLDDLDKPLYLPIITAR